MIVSGLATAAQHSLVDALHRSPSFLGVLTSLLGAGSIAAGLVSGPLIKRIGERRLAVCGLSTARWGTCCG
jgi:MFS family permease